MLAMGTTNRSATPTAPRTARAETTIRENVALKIDFALITITGNLTRFLMTRQIVDTFDDVRPRWLPIRTWVHGDFLRFLPAGPRLRLRHFLDGARVFDLRCPDAVVLHAFELSYLYPVFAKFFRPNTLIVNHPDGYFFEKRLFNPDEPGIGPVRRFVRKTLVPMAVERTDVFLSWSSKTESVLRQDWPEIPESKIEMLHPGIDLGKWPMRPYHRPEGKFRILFVGGSPRRKGADTLIQAFTERLSDTCELHLCTQAKEVEHDPEMAAQIKAAEQVPGFHVHYDLKPMSPELTELYKTCDCLVLPTRDDSNSWVSLEAQATGIPVIANPIWGISDIVLHEETGLQIPPDNPDAIADAVLRLRSDEGLRRRLIENGRRHVETHFDGHKNARRLVDLIKRKVADKRGAPQRAGATTA